MKKNPQADQKKTSPKKKSLRPVIKWILWFLLVQFILVNISASIYAYKLTHFYEPSDYHSPPSAGVLAKTWRIFTGPRFEKIKVGFLPNVPFALVHLYTRDSLRLEGWYLPLDSAQGTVILFHALGGNRESIIKEAFAFRGMGYNILMMDFRAHGNSAGNTSTIGHKESEDVDLAYEFIRKKGETNIILFGVSLGAVSSVRAVQEYKLTPSHVILEIPFNGQESLFARRGKLLGFPEQPFGVLVTFWTSIEQGFNAFSAKTSRYVESLQCPVLVLYGGRDEIVSSEETNAIFDNIPVKEKKLVEFETANHEFLLHNDPILWKNEVTAFLKK